MSDPLPLAEIPTLTLLYKLNRLVLHASSDDLPSPSATFNDKISVIRQDITTLAVDAIVNAANNSLLGGGGVDGAIHRAAGPELVEECETLDGCETGYAKITDGYELPAKKVIHAVGPIYFQAKRHGVHAELLGGCYRRSLELAVENNLKSIAFSALSTGIYGYPSGEASEVALATVRKFLDDGKGDNLDRIIFCNFMQKDEDAYFRNIPLFFPPVVTESKTTDDATEATGTTETGQLSQLPDAPTADSQPEILSQLPDAPTADPVFSEQPALKRQKTDTAEDDFVVINKEDADPVEEEREGKAPVTGKATEAAPKKDA
ncbi:MACRO domain-containing protein 1 [Dendryphion nanum]|uniref:MACRO domain-containing protein 1 n=1 Tax=Dendryphion nanum TaxID=256645 RepID=A0A9P9DZQ0_9PLEO|nr:MACRO domain-containing protein 1 [Dendryphion nanum]